MAEHLSLLVLNIWQTSHSAFLFNGHELLLFGGGCATDVDRARNVEMVHGSSSAFYRESLRVCVVYVEDKQALVPDAPRWQFN